jgi:hypothetical protein
MQTYFDHFSSLENMCENFSIDKSVLDGAKVIYAAYDCPPYEGYAHVIFMRDGKLYEVNASHCSCAGLEGQWKPEETLVNALLERDLPEQTKLVLKAYFKGLVAFL